MAEAATFPFVCPFCQQPMMAEVQDVGGIVECPGCGDEVVIPPKGTDPDNPPEGWRPDELNLEDLPTVPPEEILTSEDTAHELKSAEMRALLAVGLDDRRPDDTVIEEQPTSSASGRIPVTDDRAVDDDEAEELLAALMSDHKAVTAEKAATTPTPGGSSAAAGGRSGSDGGGSTDMTGGEIVDDEADAGDSLDEAGGPEPAEELDREAVRATHKTILKYASPFLGNAAGPPLAVYKAKSKEAPLRFAVFHREPALALGFTASHIIVSLPLERKMSLVKPDALRVQARFKKAKPATITLEGVPGTARLRILEQKPGEETSKRRVAATIELPFDADSATERTVLRLRSLINKWVQNHPFLGGPDGDGGPGDAETRIMQRPPG